MFSFFKKKKEIPIRIREFEYSRILAGKIVRTSRNKMRKDVALLQQDFYKVRKNLAQRSDPCGTCVVFGKQDEERSFSYFVGDLVDTPEQSDDFTVIELKAGAYAYLTIDFKVENDLAIKVGKAKQYFFEQWLPASPYRLRDDADIESIELYDRRSKIKLPSIDLIFPLVGLD